jgi:hypothetical protein
MKVPYREGGSDPTLAPSHASATVRLRRGVDRGNHRPGIELRNQANPGCRRCSAMRKATPELAEKRASRGPCAVRDPEHVGKFLAREPGDPRCALRWWLAGPVGEGYKPQSRYARSWEVGRAHSTEEAAEQSVLSPKRIAMGGPKRARR